MGIQAVIFKGASATWSRSGNKYKRVYDVFCDIGTADFEVLANCGFSRGDYYFGTVLGEMNLDLTHAPGDVPWLYELTLDYETMTAAEEEKVTVEPLDRSTVWEYSTREYPQIMDEDEDGKPVVNAASDPLSPALERRQGATIARATKNFDYWDASMSAALRFHTNSDTFLGFPPETLLCTSVDARQEKDAMGDIQYRYWSVTFEFEEDSEYSHRAMPLNQGFNGIKDNPAHDSDPDAPAEIKTALLDDYGQKLTEPVPLTADGHKLNDGIDPADWVDPNYLDFKQYPQVAFGSLGL